MGYVTIEGRNIYYLYPQEAEAGVKKGHTVLLVHGAYDNHRVWSSQYQYLEREHAPISLDLPGHGESEGPAVDSSQDFREFIKAFADVMGLAPFVFAGHSMGGSMALDYALHYPETLKGIVAVGAAPKWDISSELIRMWKENPDEARDRNTSYLFSKKTPGHIIERYDKQLRASSAQACLADSQACATYDLEEELHRIELPCLVICGDEEEWIDGSRSIHSRLPHSTLEIVPAAGHAVLVEQPNWFNDALGAYLSTLG